MILFLLFFTALASAVPICPPGYEKASNGICYKLYTDWVKRWEASQRCINDGAILVEIPDSSTLNLVKEFTSAGFWIGATCTEDSLDSCLYDTGASLSFGDWVTGPSQNDGPCVAMYPSLSGATWESVRCTSGAFFICQIDGRQAISCPPGFSIFAGDCYEAVVGSETEKTKTCAVDNANITSVHSFGENTFVFDLATYYFPKNLVRVGLFGDHSQYIPSAFNWIDGTPLDFNLLSIPLFCSECYCTQMKMDSTNIATHGATQWTAVTCNGTTSSVCKVDRMGSLRTTSSSSTSTSTSTTTTTTVTTTVMETTTASSSSTSTSTAKPTTTAQQTPETAVGCNAGLLQAPGTISTPYYPIEYRNNEYCLYTLMAPEGQRVELTFTGFDTEHMYDVLNVYDGDDTNSMMFGSYSGTRSPPKMTSSGNRLTLRFTSDKTTVYTGFQATFRAVN